MIGIEFNGNASRLCCPNSGQTRELPGFQQLSDANKALVNAEIERLFLLQTESDLTKRCG